MLQIFVLLFLICFGSFMVFRFVPWLLNKIIVVATLSVLVVVTVFGMTDKLLLWGVGGTWMIFALLNILHLWQTRIGFKTTN